MSAIGHWLGSPAAAWFFLGSFAVWAVVDLTHGWYASLAVDLVMVAFYIWALT